MKSVFLTGSSGVGKSTVLHKLLEKGYRSSPNHLTRPPRTNEVDGIDAFFLSEEEFIENLARGHYFEDSLEAAHYAGVYYGSPRTWLDEISEGDSPIAATPSNVVLIAGVCRVLEERNARQNLIWCNLYAPVDVRQQRIQHRVSDPEILHHRLHTGVSHGIREEADLNIDTSVVSPDKVLLTLMSQDS